MTKKYDFTLIILRNASALIYCNELRWPVYAFKTIAIAFFKVCSAITIE